MALLDGQKLCPTHDVVYGKLEQCSACRAERSKAVAPGSPKANTEPLRIRAAEYRLRELACWDKFGLLVGDDPHVAVKMSDQAGKWAGRADDLESKLLEIEHDQWLVEQKRQLGGE